LRIAGKRMALPMHAKRVLAYLSVHKMTSVDCDRNMLAERLWPDSPLQRSRGSLRTAMWRIRGVDSDLLMTDTGRVALAANVSVDVHEFRHRAEQLLADDSDAHISQAVLPNPDDLLPGWDEDWLTLTRERLRLLRLNALEQRARTLAVRGCYPQAIDLILGVVSEEPLRESAQSVLIEAHMNSGNGAEARRQYAKFAADLWLQLRIQPSERLLRVMDADAGGPLR
jgi:DNA-binding SARP family transcriptional activator